MSLPYIGASITLISKAEVRYTGALSEVDQKNATVTLKDVRSFGTEGRRPDFEMEASDQVYEYIVFKGSNIKDLQVTSVSAPVASSAPGPESDPAIISTSTGVSSSSSASRSAHQKQQRPRKNESSREKSAERAENNETNHSAEKSQFNQRDNRRYHGNYEGGEGENRRGGRGGRGRGGFRGGHRGGRGNYNGHSSHGKHYQNTTTSQIPGEDFDFEGSNRISPNNTFDDQQQTQTAQADEELTAKLAEIKLAAANVYDKKKSFFDNLSSDIKDRVERVANAEHGGEQHGRHDDRKLNMETFGVAYARGGRGGRGRGGRGTGRGRGGRGGAYRGVRREERTETTRQEDSTN